MACLAASVNADELDDSESEANALAEDYQRNASDVSTSEMLESVSELMRGVDFAAPTHVFREPTPPPRRTKSPARGQPPRINFISAITSDDTQNPPSRDLRHIGAKVQSIGQSLLVLASKDSPETSRQLPPVLMQQVLQYTAELESMIFALRATLTPTADAGRLRGRSMHQDAMRTPQNDDSMGESGESGGDADESSCETDAGSVAPMVKPECTSAMFIDGQLHRKNDNSAPPVRRVERSGNPDHSFELVWQALIETFGLRSHSRGQGSLKAPILSKTAATGLPPEAAYGICQQQWRSWSAGGGAAAMQSLLGRASAPNTMHAAYASAAPQPSASADAEASLTASNLGHRLLTGMGWTPGTGLGATRNGIVAPIQAVRRPRRQGLGNYD
ncbi:uncharacterized protein MONBRDRAFT_27045 [Monosiga brevicollis MX1]|uniref:G-patch domain-containing protein n=1 Tax=Monosiga brevicollis TaxID=81824 RepID=A9V455_MONBE|nr:uncharacterized protein MONBRDRAFT_27045 [Monosiga brevicollis MX1]EDQ87560.1 predicted protein [Monosiga brevicollis MX1]|eukprot:XP_001747480.1 hypothetical protein [Monosiga brevicollis MX1]